MAQTRIPFETIAQQQLRNVRRSSDDDHRPKLTGYVDVEGNIRGLIGDAVAPYTHAIGRASSDGTTGVVTVADGEAQRVLTDEYGRIWTRVLSTVDALVLHDAAVTTQSAVAAARRVFQVRGILDAAVVLDRFMQIHDSAAAVAANDEPVWEVLMAGGQTTASTYAESGDGFLPIGGLELTNGLVLVVSTTPGVFTPPAGDEAFFQATYTV